MDLLSFLNSEFKVFSSHCKGRRINNRSIDSDECSIYVRKMVNNGYFCIANITISEEYRGKGILKKWLLHIEDFNTEFNGIEVENIFNDQLLICLLKLGFTKKNDDFPFTVEKPILKKII